LKKIKRLRPSLTLNRINNSRLLERERKNATQSRRGSFYGFKPGLNPSNMSKRKRNFVGDTNDFSPKFTGGGSDAFRHSRCTMRILAFIFDSPLSIIMVVVQMGIEFGYHSSISEISYFTGTQAFQFAK